MSVKPSSVPETTSLQEHGIYPAPIGLLDSCYFDPATMKVWSVNALLAMTVMDTTNLRCTFVVPASGLVLVKGRVASNASGGRVLLGVMEGSEVRMRQVAESGGGIGEAGSALMEAVISLTPGLTISLDMAYAVQAVSAGDSLACGGPNDAVGANAYGAATFEVWTV